MALAAVIAGPAMAADMPLKAPPPVPVFSWTGCYAGIQGGYGYGRSKQTSAGATNGVANVTAGQDITPWFNMIGGMGGGELGCNYQIGLWVWGIEIDASSVAKEGQAQNIAPFTSTWITKTSERWNASARVRLGYAQDKWLWYITGGAIWAGFDINTSRIDISAVVPASLVNIERRSRVGWVVGFGTEYAVAYGWSVKWETLYADWGSGNGGSSSGFRAFDGVGASCGTSINCTNRDVRVYEWISRVGLNYKFDWYPGPVVAKY
jgi:outer membrane immunogenic protein